MEARVGLFGGSFNPIHHGHLLVARSLHEHLRLNRTFFLPSRQPPHKSSESLAETGHRIRMTALAVAGEPHWTVDEFDARRNDPCYTIETIEHFQRQLPAAELFWFIGSDSLMDLPSWHRAADLVRSCTIVTAARSGRAVDPAPLEAAFGPAAARNLIARIVPTPVIDVSSTDIRRRVAEGKSIRNLVPEPVRDYIAAHGLYRTPDRPDPGGPAGPSRVC
jgi:nicotinate-nucleotide adenylyltransferase